MVLCKLPIDIECKYWWNVTFLDDSKGIPLNGTEECSLYEYQNSYVFNAMSQSTSGGQARAINYTLWEVPCKKSIQGDERFLKIEYDVLSDWSPKEFEEIDSHNFPGGSLKLLTQFHNFYLELESYKNYCG